MILATTLRFILSSQSGFSESGKTQLVLVKTGSEAALTFPHIDTKYNTHFQPIMNGVMHICNMLIATALVFWLCQIKNDMDNIIRWTREADTGCVFLPSVKPPRKFFPPVAPSPHDLPNRNAPLYAFFHHGVCENIACEFDTTWGKNAARSGAEPGSHGGRAAGCRVGGGESVVCGGRVCRGHLRHLRAEEDVDVLWSMSKTTWTTSTSSVGRGRRSRARQPWWARRSRLWGRWRPEQTSVCGVVVQEELCRRLVL